MAKGWKTAFKINGDSEVKSNDKHFNNTIRNTKSLSIDELKKESSNAYAKKVAETESLLSALETGTLKSKTLIKKATKIKEEREKKAAALAEKQREIAEHAEEGV